MSDKRVSGAIHQTTSELSKLNTQTELVNVGLASLNILMKRMADVLAPAVNKVKSAMDTFRDLKPVAEKAGTSKFGKNLKSMGGMFKSMAKAGVKAWVMEKIMLLLGPFIGLLDLFSPILEVLGAILQEALMPIIQELLPYILMATTYLMENKDVIIEFLNVLKWLKIIIEFLTPYVIWLWEILVVLYEFIKNDLIFWIDLLVIIFNVLVEFIKNDVIFWIDLAVVAFEYLVEVLEDLWDIVIAVWEVLVNIYNWIVDVWIIIWNALVVVWEGVVTVIDFVSDALEIAVGWLEDFIEWIEAVADAAEDASSGGGKSSTGRTGRDPIGETWDYLFGAADGGIASSPVIAGEAGAEAIIPLERSNPFIDAIEEMAEEQRLTRILLQQLVDNSQKSTGLNRRKFG